MNTNLIPKLYLPRKSFSSIYALTGLYSITKFLLNLLNFQFTEEHTFQRNAFSNY